MSCVVTRKAHALVEIDRNNGPDGIVYVTRWCGDCGGVVVDTDVDGCTMPGDIVAMRFPKIALQAASPASSATPTADS